MLWLHEFLCFFWDIAVFKNAFPIDSANPDFSAANQVPRMGKLVKRACAHLWYSKLDSTGNKSWSLRGIAWLKRYIIWYVICFFATKRLVSWFYLAFTHAFKHWRLGHLAWATCDVSALGGCFGCTALEHHSFREKNVGETIDLKQHKTSKVR